MEVAAGQVAVLTSPANSAAPVPPDLVARRFIEARRSGSTARVLQLLDPEVVASLQQLLRDVHADERSSAFARSLESAGETDALGALLTMLFGPVGQKRTDLADEVIEVIGQVNRGSDRAIVVLRIKDFTSHFPEPLSISDLSVVSLVHRPSGWFVLPPSGDADLKTLRAMASGGFLASRDGQVVETVTMPDPSPGSVTLVSLDPPENAVLTRTSTITAELDYRVDRFEPRRFQAAVTVNETEPGMSTMGTGAPVEQPILTSGQGRVRLVYPVLAVWDNPKVKRPFEVSFCIDQLVGRLGSSVSVACTKPVTYRVAATITASTASTQLVLRPSTRLSTFDIRQASQAGAQSPAQPGDNTPEAVAKAFLDAFRTSDFSRCSALLDPDTVNEARDGLKRLAERGPGSIAKDMTPEAIDENSWIFVIGLALRETLRGLADEAVTIIGSVNESPNTAFVVYQHSSSDPAHSTHVPISGLNALRLTRQNGSWRVTTPNGSADVKALQASMSVMMAIAAIGEEYRKLNPKPPDAAEAVTSTRSAEEIAVRAVASAWRQAKIAHDLPALTRLMSPDFVEVNQNGDRVSRAQLLSLYQTSDLVFAGIEIEAMAVEIAGNRARVTGIHNEAVKYRGRDVGGRLSFTEVYVNTGGRWQIEWSQLKPAPKEIAPRDTAGWRRTLRPTRLPRGETQLRGDVRPGGLSRGRRAHLLLRLQG